MVMSKTNVAEVKAKFSEYLDRAIAGERIVICRHNKPVAELRALDVSPIEPRPIGPLPGRPTFDVPPSFFEPLSSDELDLWEGAGSQFGTSEQGAPRAPRVADNKGRFGAPARRSRRRRK